MTLKKLEILKRTLVIFLGVLLFLIGGFVGAKEFVFAAAGQGGITNIQTANGQCDSGGAYSLGRCKDTIPTGLKAYACGADNGNDPQHCEDNFWLVGTTSWNNMFNAGYYEIGRYVWPLNPGVNDWVCKVQIDAYRKSDNVLLDYVTWRDSGRCSTTQQTKYSCVSGSCQVDSNGAYSDITSCQNNCQQQQTLGVCGPKLSAANPANGATGVSLTSNLTWTYTSGFTANWANVYLWSNTAQTACGPYGYCEGGSPSAPFTSIAPNAFNYWTSGGVNTGIYAPYILQPNSQYVWLVVPNSISTGGSNCTFTTTACTVAGSVNGTSQAYLGCSYNYSGYGTDSCGQLNKVGLYGDKQNADSSWPGTWTALFNPNTGGECQFSDSSGGSCAKIFSPTTVGNYKIVVNSYASRIAGAWTVDQQAMDRCSMNVTQPGWGSCGSNALINVNVAASFPSACGTCDNPSQGCICNGATPSGPDWVTPANGTITARPINVGYSTSISTTWTPTIGALANVTACAAGSSCNLTVSAKDTTNYGVTTLSMTGNPGFGTACTDKSISVVQKPGTSTTQAVTGITDSAATINWTAPAAKGCTYASGTSCSYDYNIAYGLTANPTTALNGTSWQVIGSYGTEPSTTFTISGLASNTTYHYRIQRGTGYSGVFGDWSTDATFTTLPITACTGATPAAPDWVTPANGTIAVRTLAVSYSGPLSVTWTPTIGALASVTTCSAGTSCNVTVSAKDAVNYGTTTLSMAVSPPYGIACVDKTIAVVQKPGTPTNQPVTGITDTSATVSWGVPGTGSKGCVYTSGTSCSYDYNIAYGLTANPTTALNGTSWQIVGGYGTEPWTSYSISGLASNTTYHYRIERGTGYPGVQSDWSPDATFTTTPSATGPTPPGLDWVTPSNPPVTARTVTVSYTSQSTISWLPSVGGLAAVSACTPGTSCSVTVSAANTTNYGNTTLSMTANPPFIVPRDDKPITVVQKPGTPQSQPVAGITDTQATISWAAPGPTTKGCTYSSGTSCSYDYSIAYGLTANPTTALNGTSWQVTGGYGTEPVTTYNISGLTPGTTYHYRVERGTGYPGVQSDWSPDATFTTNLTGTSACSGATPSTPDWVTPANAPIAARTVLVGYASQVPVTWTPAIGAVAQVTTCPAGTNCNVTVSAKDTTNYGVTTLSMTGNPAFGIACLGKSISVVQKPAVPGSQPVTGITDTQATITWSAPGPTAKGCTYASGTSCSYDYNIAYGTTPNPTTTPSGYNWQVIGGYGVEPGTSLTLTGLTPDTTYHYRIERGTGYPGVQSDWSPDATFTTAPAPPSATGPIPPGPDWVTPANYPIPPRTLPVSYTSQVSETWSPTIGGIATVTTCPIGMLCNLTVSAVNTTSYGTTTLSMTGNPAFTVPRDDKVITVVQKPGVPVNQAPTGITDTQATITWTAPGAGSKGCTYSATTTCSYDYNIAYGLTANPTTALDGSSWQIIGSYGTEPATSYTIGGLTGGTTYHYREERGTGYPGVQSDWSPDATFTTLPSVNNIPTAQIYFRNDDGTNASSRVKVVNPPSSGTTNINFNAYAYGVGLSNISIKETPAKNNAWGAIAAQSCLGNGCAFNTGSWGITSSSPAYGNYVISADASTTTASCTGNPYCNSFAAAGTNLCTGQSYCTSCSTQYDCGNLYSFVSDKDNLLLVICPTKGACADPLATGVSGAVLGASTARIITKPGTKVLSSQTDWCTANSTTCQILASNPTSLNAQVPWPASYQACMNGRVKVQVRAGDANFDADPTNNREANYLKTNATAGDTSLTLTTDGVTQLSSDASANYSFPLPHINGLSLTPNTIYYWRVVRYMGTSGSDYNGVVTNTRQFVVQAGNAINGYIRDTTALNQACNNPANTDGVVPNSPTSIIVTATDTANGHLYSTAANNLTGYYAFSSLPLVGPASLSVVVTSSSASYAMTCSSVTVGATGGSQNIAVKQVIEPWAQVIGGDVYSVGAAVPARGVTVPVPNGKSLFTPTDNMPTCGIAVSSSVVAPRTGAGVLAQ